MLSARFYFPATSQGQSKRQRRQKTCSKPQPAADLAVEFVKKCINAV
jgi:hypothetical protein